MSEWFEVNDRQEIDSSELSQFYTIGPHTESRIRRESTPTSRHKIRHVLVIKDKLEDRVIHLDATTYSIGRHPANSILIKDPMVSRQHALLSKDSQIAFK